jgi:hypothetical protein
LIINVLNSGIIYLLVLFCKDFSKFVAETCNNCQYIYLKFQFLFLFIFFAERKPRLPELAKSRRTGREAKPARLNDFSRSGGESCHGLKMKSLSCRTMPARTKADKTSFRATRGHASALGVF